MAKPAQLSFPQRGGRRRGAGRPRRRKSSVPHRRRPVHKKRHPVHITMRLCDGLPSLRRADTFDALRDAIVRSSRAEFRVVHFSAQSNHVHLIVEADDAKALSRGMQGLAVRAARALNRVLARRGTVWADRYHAHTLQEPPEARNAIRYVIWNAQHHGGPRFDPCSLPVDDAQTWLARGALRSLGRRDAQLVQ